MTKYKVDKAQLGENIRKIRKSRNLSQAELAALLEMTRPKLSDLERGVREPPFSVVVKMSKFLDTKLDNFAKDILKK